MICRPTLLRHFFHPSKAWRAWSLHPPFCLYSGFPPSHQNGNLTVEYSIRVSLACIYKFFHIPPTNHVQSLWVTWSGLSQQQTPFTTPVSCVSYCSYHCDEIPNEKYQEGGGIYFSSQFKRALFTMASSCWWEEADHILMSQWIKKECGMLALSWLPLFPFIFSLEL